MRTTSTVVAILAAAFALGVTPGAVTADPIGQAEKGRDFAAQVCAECHAISPDDVHSPMPGVAGFAEIAAAPGMTAMALNVWLTSSHRDMPNLILTQDQREDVIAYITSLKR